MTTNPASALGEAHNHTVAFSGIDVKEVDVQSVTYEVLCQAQEGVLRGVVEVRMMEHPRCRKPRRARAYQPHSEC